MRPRVDPALKARALRIVSANTASDFDPVERGRSSQS